MANSKNNGNTKDLKTNMDRESVNSRDTGTRINRRNNKRAKRKSDNDMRLPSKSLNSAANDVSWYTINPQLLTDVASLPFSEPLGKPLSLGSKIIGSEETDFAVTTPGVMAIRYYNHIGDAGSAASPINIAATNIYSYVRHENSGHANYDAPDLMIYLLAMDNIYSAIAYLRRVYATALSYSIKNRYYPRILLEAMGIDFDEVFPQLANLRAQINMLSVKASTLCVPNTMKYFTRHTWLCENIYTDAPLLKSQSYVFVPDGWYEFAINASSSKGELGLVKRPQTLQDIITLVNDMIDAMLEQEDFGIMSGDILKAYGATSLFTFTPLTENATITPVYSPEVLAQIHNCVSISDYIGDDYAFSIGNITQSDDGLITQNIEYTLDALQPSPGDNYYIPFYFGLEQYLVDLPLEHPTAADVMIATRLTSMMRKNENSDFSVSAASELVIGFTTYRFSATGTITEKEVNSLDVIDVAGTNSAYQELLIHRDWHRFAQAPLLYRLFVDQSGEPMIYPSFSLSGDLDNYTAITFNTLRQINETAMLSLFDVGMRYRS